MRRTLFGLACVIGSALVGVSPEASHRNGEGDVQAAATTPAQPEQIIPFSADYVGVRTYNGSASVEVGRFYRAQDNSFRRESGPAPGEIALVNVRHVAHGAFYVWSKQRGFSSYAVSSPPRGWGFIHQRRVTADQWLDEKYEGFDVVRTAKATGVKLELPQLNFFAAYAKFCGDADGASWCNEYRYSNIKVGPQSPELFDPPDGPLPARSPS